MVNGVKVKGYTEQTEQKVDWVNMNKVIEESLLRLVDGYFEYDETDKRWLSIAETHFEQGFMALNRSIFKPQRIKLDIDEE